jgi:uncharacterized protein (UPF0332 family)
MAENRETIRLYLQAAAEELQAAQHNINGGYYGVAVSRAYYAIFYAASAALLTQGIERHKHSAVLAAFRQYFVKPGKIETRFSDIFGEAFELRQATDYDMLITTDREQATALLQHAQEFVERMQGFIQAEEYDV